MILDPVWNPKNKDKLKEEYLTWGSKRALISYTNNQKNALLFSHSLKAKIKPIFKKDQNRHLISKSINIGAFTGQICLIFMKGIVIPVSGKWKFS